MNKEGIDGGNTTTGLVFETKKDCNQFIKSFTNNKDEVLSCFAYEVIE